MDLENENKVIVGIRMNPADVKILRDEAKKKRTSLSGLIREKIFRDENI
tara:strand:+ start:307 stop:453 length:147 start_codon:yes stop_codon:yes gene_type:complete